MFTQLDARSNVLAKALFSLRTRSSLSEEIQCYPLPYGVIGLVSHILTFYTVYWVGRDRRPLFPWKKLTQHWLGAMLGVLVIVATTVLCIDVFVRCKDHWPMLFLGIWMWFSGLLNGVVAVHVALVRRHYIDLEHISDEHAHPLIWNWFYGLGVAIGLSGLISFYKPEWSSNYWLRRTSRYTIGIVILIWILSSIRGTILLRRQESDNSKPSSLKVIRAIFLILLMIIIHVAPLYSDVVLGIVTDNILGLRSGSVQIVFWFYFFVQRLTMLSL